MIKGFFFGVLLAIDDKLIAVEGARLLQANNPPPESKGLKRKSIPSNSKKLSLKPLSC
jgi:hypothetical protein